MNLDDLKGLKYYIAACVLAMGFFVYSHVTGWLWFNPTRTESQRSGSGSHGVGHVYRYHK